MRLVPLRSLTKAIRPVADEQAPQSPAQVLQVSSPLQLPSPQAVGQAPQSAAQSSQVSTPLQLPSPQTEGQAPQSAAHSAQVSSPLQALSPQDVQGPQSAGHVEHVSCPEQTPFPQPRVLRDSSAAVDEGWPAAPHPTRSERRARQTKADVAAARSRTSRRRISHRSMAYLAFHGGQGPAATCSRVVT